MFDLAGKTALVTGASGGIGKAIAEALVGAGAKLAISGTRAGVLEELASTLKGGTTVLPCNLANPDEVDGLIKRAEEALGHLDILVSNAGVTRDNLLMRMKDAEWDEVIKVNLTATFRLARAAMRGMMKQRWGRIVSITSVVGATGNPGQANYAAAKAGLTGMIKAIAQEVASRNITANCIAPGFIASPMTDVLGDKVKESLLARIPAGRLGTPADVAAGVVYLASEEAAYITGQTLHINGGMAML
jgi:3-oxoacyl-[acyl-carrier protein] reductase